METIRNMPAVSIVVVAIILGLFALSVVMLIGVCIIYRRQRQLAVIGDTVQSNLLHTAAHDFEDAYRHFGQDTNTPAIVTGSVHRCLSLCLFCERFLSNAVSLFVTLGLFGTFLGLSMSVASLTELISFSNTSEWLGVLDSVGGGLMSALSGMGVAFYTSLFGVACSILLTILRAVLSPDSLRTALETEMELWLDHRVAPKLDAVRPKDDSAIVERMIVGLNTTAAAMDRTMKQSTASLKAALDDFHNTVEAFSKSTRDFSEFDYNLRGTVERMDLTLRELTAQLRSVERDFRRE